MQQQVRAKNSTADVPSSQKAMHNNEELSTNNRYESERFTVQREPVVL